MTIYKINPLKLNENVKNWNVDNSISIASLAFIFGGFEEDMSTNHPPNMNVKLAIEIELSAFQIFNFSFSFNGFIL